MTKSTHYDTNALAAATETVNTLGGIIDPEDLANAEQIFASSLEFEIAQAYFQYIGRFEVKRSEGIMNLCLSSYTPPLNEIVSPEFFMFLNEMNRNVVRGTFVFFTEENENGVYGVFSYVQSIRMEDDKVVNDEVEHTLKFSVAVLDRYLSAILDFITAPPVIRVDQHGNVKAARPKISIAQAMALLENGKYGHS